jgi:ribosomal protein S4
MNKHFFKKQSTLSYIEKLRRRNYSIKCRKTISFCYIIERRLLVVLTRLCITRIKQPQELRFLIHNGYISVNNKTIKDPQHLTPHTAIIRILKTIPRVLAKVPKSSLTNNLRWLFLKRARRKGKKPFWRVLGKRKAWYRPKKLPYTWGRSFVTWRRGKKHNFVLKGQKGRRYLRGEPRTRTRPYR